MAPNWGPVTLDDVSGSGQETWLKYQTEEYKKAWPKPEYMSEPREMVYVRDGGDGLEIPVESSEGWELLVLVSGLP